MTNMHLDGPGKRCRHLGIIREYNGINIIKDKNLYITTNIEFTKPLITPRIGMKKAIDKPWRFLIV